MKQEPDFTDTIEAGRRAAKERQAAEAEAQAAMEAARKRLAARALEQLEHVVLPLLEIARRNLQESGILAEVGNGRDQYGCMRYSLRLCRHHAFPPVLVFTATHTGPGPHVGHHSEFIARKDEYFPQEIREVTTAAVESIIRAFLAQATASS